MPRPHPPQQLEGSGGDDPAPRAPPAAPCHPSAATAAEAAVAGAADFDDDRDISAADLGLIHELNMWLY